MTPGYKTHLFICTNSPDKPGKCGSKGSEKLRQQLKESCKTQGWDVRVNTSGCLGYCEHGIAAVVYPQTEWLLDLKDTDHNLILQKIKAHLKS